MMGAWTLLRFCLQVAQASGKTAAGACLVGGPLWFPCPRSPAWKDNAEKVRKGQEREHADRLARGPDVPNLLDGGSSLALNNLRLSLCHKQSQLMVLRRALAKSV